MAGTSRRALFSGALAVATVTTLPSLVSSSDGDARAWLNEFMSLGGTFHRWGDGLAMRRPFYLGVDNDKRMAKLVNECVGGLKERVRQLVLREVV